MSTGAVMTATPTMHEQQDVRSSHRSRGWVPVLSMLGVTLLGSLIPLVRTPGFYFWDDTAGVAVGVWQRIAADVLSGQNPFLQVDMWRGGNLIAEAATGMWNPVMLALMVGTSPIDDVGAAITVAKLVLFLLAAGGVYMLARQYGASPWMSAAAGATLALSGWAIFMDGSSWINGSAITAFTPWAWWGLRRAYKTGFRPWSIVVAAALCYLVPSTGNPYGVLTLAAVFLAVAIEAIAERRARAIWWLVGIGFGVLLTVVVVYLPFLFTSAYGFRANSQIANDEFLAVSVSDLLGLSTPTHRPYILMFGRNPMGFPGTYLGWFVLPLLPWLRWRSVRWRSLTSVLVFGGLFLLITLGPSQLGMFRWPARLVPFIYLAVIVLFAVLASRGLHRDRLIVRSWISGGIILLGVWIAYSDVPGSFKWHGLVTLLIVAGTAAIVFWTGVGWRGFAVMTGGLLLFMGAQVMLTASNQNVADYDMPSSKSALREQFADRADGLTVQVFDIQALVGGHGAPQRWDDLLAGNMPSVAGFESTTAYSGIGFTAFDGALCMSYNGGTCAQAWDALWDAPQGSDVPLADLLGAKHVVVLNDFADDEEAPEGWSVSETTDVVTIYTRDDPLPFPAGTLTIAGEGAEVTADERVGKTSERLEVSTTTGDTSLTFGRIAWPGYAATLNGQAVPTEIGPAGLLTIVLPEQSEGELVLSFTPPGLYGGLAIAAAGLAILTVCVVLAARRGKGASSTDASP
jgi:hypothetical protein